MSCSFLNFPLTDCFCVYVLQSQGNVDLSLYATIPDNKLTLTENGVRQARVSVHVPPQSLPSPSLHSHLSPSPSPSLHSHHSLSFTPLPPLPLLTPLPISQAAGIELKKLVGDESVTFYVSPFTRSRQTYELIQQAFPEEQVRLARTHHRADPDGSAYTAGAEVP